MMPLANQGGIPSQQHKRSRSAVLKSLVAPSSKGGDLHKKTTSQPPVKRNISEDSSSSQPKSMLSTTSEYSFSKVPLGELNNLQGRRSSPRKGARTGDENASPMKSLHKKNKSTISLKSLTRGDKNKTSSQKDAQKSIDEDRPKKSKSSSGLSAFLSKTKSSRAAKDNQEPGHWDKENCSPPKSSIESQPPPIWAQFATREIEGKTNLSRPLSNTSWDINREIELYTPQDYSPSKGRYFQDAPSLSRPLSGMVDSSAARTLSEKFAKLRRTSSSSTSSSRQERATQKSEKKPEHQIQGPHLKSFHQRVLSAAGKKREDMEAGKSASRVKAAVAVFNGKNKDAAPISQSDGTKLKAAAIDQAFEAMLESRNTPWDVKEKMRRLDTNLKSEFIRQNKSSTNLAEAAKDNSRPGTAKHSELDSAVDSDNDMEAKSLSKKSRPRSLTFTLSKDSSPKKKQRSGKAPVHIRNKSVDLPRSSSSKSIVMDTGVSGLFARSQKLAIPEDFIVYIKKVQAPENVELGRLQKLRQLLRNETVAWTDSFIVQGGMDEIVGLLHRIIAIEWREEHEDNLLHHTLDCLRALLTTKLAINNLSRFESTLFPALLNLLFSSGEDKKGPSEFTTRNIIMAILFAYLTGSRTPERAHALLSYLADPAPPESKRPLNFIESMHRPRPYKRWCTEVSNVSKEVFWIFLHSVNVIPYQSISPTTPLDASFMAKWYPAVRPPVPAAPYVGGVEWDATTYIATHLDLLNGLMACLPSREERNQLRQELKDSGWEKVMGGSLRTCKEKFYGGVHAGLGTFVGAGREDGWNVKPVKEGPPREKSVSPRKSPRKKADEAPKLDDVRVEVLPKLEVRNGDIGDWI